LASSVYQTMHIEPLHELLLQITWILMFISFNFTNLDCQILNQMKVFCKRCKY